MLSQKDLSRSNVYIEMAEYDQENNNDSDDEREMGLQRMSTSTAGDISSAHQTLKKRKVKTPRMQVAHVNLIFEYINPSSFIY